MEEAANVWLLKSRQEGLTISVSLIRPAIPLLELDSFEGTCVPGRNNILDEF